jgi:NADH-quinone oxidoreductase subunit F
VDLHLTRAEATPAERAVVSAFLAGRPDAAALTAGDGAGRAATNGDGRFASTGHDVRGSRHLLLPALHAVVDEFGWLSEGALNEVARRLVVPPAEVYGVASFYALFSLEPRPGRVAHVCEDLVCRTAGSGRLMAALETELGPAGEPAPDGATWLPSPCLGMCERAPAVFCQRAAAPDTTLAPAHLGTVAAALAPEAPTAPAPPLESSAPQTADPGAHLRLLRRAGVADPTDLDSYRAHDGYRALRAAIGLGREGVLREVGDSKLLGRGGAAFPTGVKWRACAQSPDYPHYLICNADESEPGTFKDRVLMEYDPFAVVEAMTIAGYATGCERGYVYLRGEYPLAYERLAGAVEQARARGYLGADVLGAGFAFDVEIRRGAGAYICGEETALMESIEGKRGEPRNKPPFPTQVGLFGQPTVVNNVETLLGVLDVLDVGGPGYAKVGTAASTGTKLFCVSGSVVRPGLYEVPFGVRLRDLLDLSGGLPAGRALQAVLLGGAAGGFVTADELDLPLTYEDTRAAGATLGSGAVIVFDETVDLYEMVLRVAAFFRDESCGQCVPCRVGVVRQEEALVRLGRDRLQGGADVGLLSELAQVMRDASICALGQTAPSAVQSALAKGLIARSHP